MSAITFTHYCLGNGAPKCDGCQKEKNWQYMNEMPDAWRKKAQSETVRVIDDECILLGRPFYE